MAEQQSWRLASASGSEAALWWVTGRGRRDGEDLLVCDVVLTGPYFEGLLGSGASGASGGYAVTLPDLEVTAAALDRLARELGAWLALPPAGRWRQPLAVECRMGALGGPQLGGPRLDLSLGRRNDTLSGIDPAAALRFQAGGLRGELVFAIEPAALAGFVAGIEAALADPAGSGERANGERADGERAGWDSGSEPRAGEEGPL